MSKTEGWVNKSEPLAPGTGWFSIIAATGLPTAMLIGGVSTIISANDDFAVNLSLYFALKQASLPSSLHALMARSLKIATPYLST